MVAQGTGGSTLVMGLSHANLDLLAANRPIRFDLTPHGGAGQLMIAQGDERLFHAPERDGALLIVLTPRTTQALRTGEVMTVPLDAACGFQTGVLYAGTSERAMLEEAQRAFPGLQVNPAEWALFDAHERCEAAGCAPCAERKRSRSLRERVFAHPYLTVAAGLAACAAVAWLLERLGWGL